MNFSPYGRTTPSAWLKTTRKLLADFPLPTDELVEVVLDSWADIFRSKIGKTSFRIGKEIFPQPQIMGFLLHELIPLNLASRHPDKWRRGLAATESDAKCLFNDACSFEIKTSSSTNGIFGNRSYAHVSETAKKRRSGYMLAVNFQKFISEAENPTLTLIRFGWLEPTDWIGQTAESGQQARLTKEAIAYKLIVLWDGTGRQQKLI